MSAKSTRTPKASNHIAYDLLARAHSPTIAEEIFQENVIRRPLLIRRTTAADRPSNERDARRRAREAKAQDKARRKAKPPPLSAKQKRALGIHQIPLEQQKYDIFVPLHQLWLAYVRELLGVERAKELGLALDPTNAGSALASADWHGAKIEIVKCKCVNRVGLCGIVAKETRGTFEIITEKNELKGIDLAKPKCSQV
jgi:ribonuclease P protein subunit POP4